MSIQLPKFWRDHPKLLIAFGVVWGSLLAYFRWQYGDPIVSFAAAGAAQSEVERAARKDAPDSPLRDTLEHIGDGCKVGQAAAGRTWSEGRMSYTLVTVDVGPCEKSEFETICVLMQREGNGGWTAKGSTTGTCENVNLGPNNRVDAQK